MEFAADQKFNRNPANMDPLEKEVVDILYQMKGTEERGTFSKELYDNLMEALASIAANNGMNKTSFFKEAEKIFPFETDDQFNDGDFADEDKEKEGRFWKKLNKVTAVLRFINASYQFIKNVNECFNGTDSD